MVVIVGASGFIGKNLLKGLNGAQGVSVRTDDWPRYVLTASTVVNLIGKAHDHHSKAVELDYYHVNVELTKEIFKVFLKSTAQLFIQVSSIAAVEEFESSQELVETDECRPQSWYGKSKKAADEWLLSQNLPENKKVIIVRPPMVHGPGDKGNLKLLYKLLSKGIPYPLAAFENRRSFISIDNFIFFVEQIIKNQNLLSSGIYHVADDDSVSTNDIINIIKQLTNKTTISFKLPKFLIKGVAKIGDVLPIPLNSMRLKKLTGNLLVSNNKIKALLNIDKLPLTSIEGLEKTIRSFRDK